MKFIILVLTALCLNVAVAAVPPATTANPDAKCLARGGVCKDVSQCTGSIVSGLCGGPVNRKCCLPLPPAPPATTAAPSGRGSILPAARTWSGTPYLYGGVGNPARKGPNGPGIDCSALVWRAITESGSPLFTRLTSSNWVNQATIPGWTRVNAAQCNVAGYVVAWSGHVGIVTAPNRVWSATSNGVRDGDFAWWGVNPAACWRRS